MNHGVRHLACRLLQPALAAVCFGALGYAVPTISHAMQARTSWLVDASNRWFLCFSMAFYAFFTWLLIIGRRDWSRFVYATSGALVGLVVPGALAGIVMFPSLFFAGLSVVDGSGVAWFLLQWRDVSAIAVPSVLIGIALGVLFGRRKSMSSRGSPQPSRHP